MKEHEAQLREVFRAEANERHQTLMREETFQMQAKQAAAANAWREQSYKDSQALAEAQAQCEDMRAALIRERELRNLTNRQLEKE